MLGASAAGLAPHVPPAPEGEQGTMIRVVESVVIARPVETVFDAAAHPQTQLAWDPGTLKHVEPLTPAPLGLGARYRGRFKGMGTVEYEFAEFDRPRRFAHLARMPFGTIRHGFSFESVPDGTILTQEGVVEPTLLGRLLAPLMRRMLAKRFRTIGRELQTYLATPPHGVSPAPLA